jgi:hypothetical protein
MRKSGIFTSMRKEPFDATNADPLPPHLEWLDLDSIATVQVSSEDEQFPIEGALLGDGKGWRAGSEGTQTIRLVFDKPENLSRIWLVFDVGRNILTLEFVLRWSSDVGETFHEIVRQQWNFNPPHSTRETEDYAVDLVGVTTLELIIVPDKSGGKVKASLDRLRLA